MLQCLPEVASVYLFGGITQGAFSPPWSDVDLILWVQAPEVDAEMAERAFTLWRRLAQMPCGELVYLYVAPLTVVSGPLRPEGGGVPGKPASLRVYRGKARAMEGYPLSLPDTVSLMQDGQLLYGTDVGDRLPRVGPDWAPRYLRVRLAQLRRAVEQGTGPFGPALLEAVGTWGPTGIMSHPLWFARHLYSLETGRILSKEAAIDWYLGRWPEGALADALRLIQGWRRSGIAPSREVATVARLIRPALREFLGIVFGLIDLPEPLGETLQKALQLMQENRWGSA
jgi:hypothetical protein